MFNSDGIAAEKMIWKYFEPGNTFMSADSFHHQVEKSMENLHNVYDLSDFREAALSANSRKVKVISMDFSDFSQWQDHSSQYKLKKKQPVVYLHDIVIVQAQRGKMSSQYANAYGVPLKDLNFLNTKVMKGK